MVILLTCVEGGAQVKFIVKKGNGSDQNDSNEANESKNRTNRKESE